MQRVDGRFVYSASDLNEYLECRRLTGLSREVAMHHRAQPSENGATRALIAEKGLEHERRYLSAQRDKYGDHLVAFDDAVQSTIADWQNAEAQTIEAMRKGAHLIYQPTFFDGTFLGRADFLRRVAVPSNLGAWSDEVIDTKLALATKAYFLIQLCNYSEHVHRIQGVMPQHGYIVLGSGKERGYRLEDYSAYYRHLKRSFLQYVHVDLTHSGAELPYPVECAHCETCKWDAACADQRDADDHLSLVAFMRQDQIKKFEGAGIATVAQLAAATEAPYKMAEKTFDYLRAQARQQHLQREAVRSGRQPQHFFDFRPFDPQCGFARMPQPNAADVFFDIEGDPLYRADRGLEYLWGYYLPLEDAYHAIWATELSAERRAFEAFVDMLRARLQEHPDLHVYHYGSYEPARLRRLMGEYGTRENEVNHLLSRKVFCDLYNVVRQGLWISAPSYSIKQVEAFYGFERTAKTKRGDDSILMFESWLSTRDDGILDDIRHYNDEDCRSTHRLRQWLLALRQSLSMNTGAPIPWASVAEESEKGDDDEITSTERALLRDLPEPESSEELRSWAPDMRARWLLGNLQRYHRREQRPDWWKYFERIDNVDDLEEFDNEAIGGLHLRADIPAAKAPGERTPVYTFEFPPQEHYLRGDPICPDTRKKAGKLIEIQGTRHLLRLKLNSKLQPDKLRALIPGTPLSDAKKRAALQTIGELYLSGDLHARHPALIDILLARRPRLHDPVTAYIQPPNVTKESVSTIVQRLDDSTVFVQGPPGSGKTTTGAWTIVDLLQAGKRVGIAAHSHKAVHNLLRKIEETAHERKYAFRGCHKESSRTEGSAYTPYEPWPMINSADDLAALLSSDCRLVAGTTFAWADEAMAGDGFDYLFIDEAGQVSLADALVVARAAKNVVLLGDPMQLPHVSKGSHPVGTSLSVLDHLRGDAATVPPDYGIFLEHSYRMEHRICEFISRAVYDGRLHPFDETENNRVDSPGLSGQGLVYLPVAHEGNRNGSDEEAQRIVAEVGLLLRGTVAIRRNPVRPLTQDGILIVAPYNVQRVRIKQLLEQSGYASVEVGTVDKFQGKEAPVVLYSMAASTADDVPRGMEFLFDRNRFNVAISRGQCMSVLVCSPHLLDAHCRTPEQMALVNLLCSFAEAARTV